MSKYSKEFKEEAIRLSDEIGNKKAAAQLGLPYYTLADWRNKSKHIFSYIKTGSEFIHQIRTDCRRSSTENGQTAAAKPQTDGGSQSVNRRRFSEPQILIVRGIFI